MSNFSASSFAPLSWIVCSAPFYGASILVHSVCPEVLTKIAVTDKTTGGPSLTPQGSCEPSTGQVCVSSFGQKKLPSEMEDKSNSHAKGLYAVAETVS